MVHLTAVIAHCPAFQPFQLAPFDPELGRFADRDRDRCWRVDSPFHLIDGIDQPGAVAAAEVSEAVDLILYYCRQIEEHHGYELPLGGTGAEQTRSVLRPYGVWAVVGPFNFPLALATGMAAGALVAGNTVVFKPASDTPLSGLRLYEVLRDSGLPPAPFSGAEPR